MIFETITWWKDAYQVYQNDQRLGIVNMHQVTRNGVPREIWFAHNKNFCELPGDFPTRKAAAQALPTKAIHQPIAAFS